MEDFLKKIVYYGLVWICFYLVVVATEIEEFYQMSLGHSDSDDCS